MTVKNVPCPRCGAFAKYLIYPYWESPFAEKGGFCSTCALKASILFEEKGWPEMPENKDWTRFPYNCECGNGCDKCCNTGILWTGNKNND